MTDTVWITTEELERRVQDLENENRDLRRRLFEPSLSSVVDASPEQTEGFDRAQEQVAASFLNFAADPARARIGVGDRRYVLLRGESASVDFFRKSRSLFGGGEERNADTFSGRLLYDIAHSAGSSDCRDLCAELELTDPAARMAHGPAHFAYCGFGRVEILEGSAPSSNFEFRLVYRHAHTFETEAWKGSDLVAHEPICSFNSGYAAGWCTEAFGIPLVAVEITCEATEHEHCTFIMAPAQHLDAFLATLSDRFGSKVIAEARRRHAGTAIPGDGSADALPSDRLRQAALALDASRGQLEHKLAELDAEVREHTQTLARLEQTQSALDEINSTVLWLDPSGTILYANRASCDRYGFGIDDARTATVFDIDTRTSHEHYASIWKRMVRSGRVTLRSWQRDQHGREFPVEIHASHHVQGDREFAFCIIEDITDALEHQDKLEAALRVAEEAAKAKTNLLAVMSHELRTPLAAVIGMTELLQMTELDEEQREFAGVANDSATHLHELIDSILDFSAFDAGFVELESIELNLPELMDSVLTIVRPRLKSDEIELRIEIDDDVPHAFASDPGRLKQVLINLAANATKFTESGSIVLRAHCVHQSNSTLRLRFEVVDTGAGIEVEARPGLFEAFKQADATVKRTHGGSGLGLAISKRIAELMGGSIGVESEVKVGSTFWFTIDARPLDH